MGPHNWGTEADDQKDYDTRMYHDEELEGGEEPMQEEAPMESE